MQIKEKRQAKTSNAVLAIQFEKEEPQDLESVKQERDYYKMLAYTDVLTGAPNKNFLFEQVKRDEIVANRYGIMLDIDGFKAVNDNLGHIAADELVMSLFDYLKTKVRNSDTVCRYGCGDEFVILLPNCTSQEASDIEKRIVEGLSIHQFKCRKGSFTLELSVQSGILRNLDDLDKIDTKMLKLKQAKKIRRGQMIAKKTLPSRLAALIRLMKI